jgi:hypothetical protein
MSDIIVNIDNNFKLPIFYLEDKMELSENIIDDLEMLKSKEDENNTIYDYLFNNTNDIDNDITREVIVNQMSKYYTTNISFLENTQDMLLNKEIINQEYQNNNNNILEIWKEIKYDVNFNHNYGYIGDKSWINFLNNSEHFLQISSIYNLITPFLNFLYPIFVLIFGVIILKMKKMELTKENYFHAIKTMISTNCVYKLFTQFFTLTTNEKIYNLFSCFIYVFTTYQNIVAFKTFIKNINKIYDYVDNIKKYLTQTLDKMNLFIKITKKYDTYKFFNEILNNKYNNIQLFLSTLENIKCYRLFKLNDYGNVLKTFYTLHTNTMYDDLITYSFGFNSYINLIIKLGQNINIGNLGVSTFLKENDDNKNLCIKSGYHPTINKDKLVKNIIKMDKNIIISGPNASGKTTSLKSTLINIIITQQVGCGFYEKCNIHPFKYLHCYLNIPDTSGRDSLFQAEARRCKMIIDSIKLSNISDTHFCIFDELYSGTNPEDAISSGYSFLLYLSQKINVKFILTTHFIKLCKKFRKNNLIHNYHMKTDDKCNSKYLLVKGISIYNKGGIKILRDMNFPNEIMQTIDNDNNQLK